jgi:transcriptional regulator with XRE-family HTH domain
MMLEGFLPIPLIAETAAVHYRPRPAIYARVPVTEPPWPLREVGTGGLALESFIRDAFGYQPVTVLEPMTAEPEAPYAKLMRQVKAGFGRTMSRLPEVFGVSRQTLYNWLEGETPKLAHQERLRQLAEAAHVFQELGFKPTALTLDRSVAQGKNFLQLLADGADGKETAKKLIRIVQRGNESGAKLDELLGGRKAKLTGADIGAPSLNEDA